MHFRRLSTELFFPLSSPWGGGDPVAMKAMLSCGKRYRQRLVDCALRNGTEGLVFLRLAELLLEEQRVRGSLEPYYRHNLYRNLHQAAAIRELLELFRDTGIAMMPLKGVIAAERFFHDPGAYPSGDIDILVHPDDLARVVAMLEECAGYHPVGPHGMEELQAGHYHLLLHNGSWLLEVHWNLVKRYCRIPPEFWWEETHTIDWRDMDVLEPAPEKYLLYAVFRLFDHCFFPLRFLLFVGALLEHAPGEIRADVLLEHARCYGMQRMTIFTLHLSHELTGACLPDGFPERRIRGHGLFKRLVVSGILQGVGRKHARMMWYSLLLDTPGAVGRALLGRLWPSRAELCLRYELAEDSPKVLLYYLLNPFLLLCRSSGEVTR